MDDASYAAYWKRFYWSEFAVNLLVQIVAIQSFIRSHQFLPLLCGFLVMCGLRLLFHWLVRCPRCHQHFFRRLYMLDAKHRCQHCDLNMKPQ